MTGRITSPPAAVWHEEVLAPQFHFEAANYLPWYVLIEKVLVAEYRRMGLMTGAEAIAIASALDAVTAENIAANPQINMSDMAFAIERCVLGRLDAPIPAWHVDRSRNDLQACAQLLFSRERLLDCAAAMAGCAEAALALAKRHTTTPMPGFTHLQPAQVITPGFYLAALSDHLISTLGRLLATFDRIDACPLGAGAMAGQELRWDRTRMAKLLGFPAPQAHPLVAVASRSWVLQIAAEFSTFGVTLSRFITDLMTWGSSAYGLIDLPDELSGISSAMPQKKNFPILERIRGRTAHLAAYYLETAMAQRNTPFSNSIEAAKESGSERLADNFTVLASLLALLCGVLENMTFRADRMRAACEHDHLGGFSLANLLTLQAGIPWRVAQVIVGEYVVAAQDAPTDATLFGDIARRHGYTVARPADLLARTSDPEELLRAKAPESSAHPLAVESLIGAQRNTLTNLRSGLRQRVEAARPADIDRLLNDQREDPCATRT